MTIKTTSQVNIGDRFVRSQRYHPDWIQAGISGSAHPLWLCEWLTQVPRLQEALAPGAQVLDLGCGRGLSSVFLAAEFGVSVTAVDLWFAAHEREQRFVDSGYGAQLRALQGDVRALDKLGLVAEQFDVIICIDSFPYYGTDDTLLSNLLRFLKPGGLIGVAGAGLMTEIEHIPRALKDWWTPELACLHSPSWWQKHWQRSGLLDEVEACALDDGWRYWLEWQNMMFPDNHIEINALVQDQGETLGYVRTLARRLPITLEAPIIEIPTEYHPHPLWRSHKSQ